MYRLLIADDEMVERAVLYKTLEENLGEQCEIFQAESDREALRIYEEEKIQIAILDTEMPKISRIGAAEKTRETDKDCCIIFLTAFDEFIYAKKAVIVRVLDYLLEPYNDEELILAVEEAMRLAGEWEGEKETFKQEQAGGPDGIGVEHRGARSPEDITSEEGPEETDNVRLSKVAEMIAQYTWKNYMYDLSMQGVTRVMNYSEAYLCKLSKQRFNRNFTSYLMEYRVEEAKKMLAEPMMNVKEIGRVVGYSDSNYFVKILKQITGQNPTGHRLDIFQKD